MKFIPYDRMTYKTTLKPQEALQKITEAVNQQKSFWVSYTKPFYGKIDGYNFSITRTTHSRGFRPVITGEIAPEMGGSSIKITIRPRFIEVAFIIILFAGSFYFPTNPVKDVFLNNSSGSLQASAFINAILYIALILFVLYLAFLIGSKLETNRSKELLKELFQPYRVDE